MSGARVVVVGMGADGWEGLTPVARRAVLRAEEIFGAPRLLASLPGEAGPRRPWPSPMSEAVRAIAARAEGEICVLASGDPMLHGVGAILARALDPARLEVLPHVSAFALACARLRWSAAEVTLVSAVARPAEVVAAFLQPRRRIVVLVSDGDGAAAVARVLCERGYGSSRLAVLEQLGGPRERVREGLAQEWVGQPADPLHVVAVECTAGAGAALLPRAPGMEDAAYENDGALTKWPVRAVTLGALRPAPHALLWDVGAGSGSISIEWLRAEPTARAAAIERRADRVERIARNALALGVPHLEAIRGEAPGALAGLPTPDAIFIGGGVTGDELLERCWDSLAPGGRLVANAVTLESERVLLDARARYGGELLRLEISHAGSVGSYSAWRPQMPVLQWACAKPLEEGA